MSEYQCKCVNTQQLFSANGVMKCYVCREVATLDTTDVTVCDGSTEELIEESVELTRN